MEAGDILVRRGLLDPEQLEKSRQGVGEGTNVVNVAIDLGYVDEEVALRALAEEVDADDVVGHQVRGELDALEGAPEGLGEGLGEGCLADAGHVLDEDVAPAE